MIIKLEPMESNDLLIIQQLKKLIANYIELFYSVIVHGSVATQEIINFSDFDGLLIVNDQFKNSNDLKKFISESMTLIHQFDPLQHHEWFIIYKSQLNDYPQNYLPYEILYNSKLLYPTSSKEIKLEIKTIPDYKKTFNNLTNGIRKKIPTINKYRTAFQLKSYLSQIMLIPAMYLAVKEVKGIDKKQSFKLIKEKFSDELLFPIQVASKIREEWDYKLSPMQATLLNSKNKIIRELMRRFLSKQMKPEHKKLINSEEFIKSLELLLNRLENEVN